MTKRTLTTTLTVTMQSGKVLYNLPNSDILRKSTITGMCVTVSDTNPAVSPLGNTVCGEDTIKGAFITIVSDSNKFMDDCPLELLLKTDQRLWFETHQDGLGSTQSYIRFPDSTYIQNGEDIVIIFRYEY